MDEALINKLMHINYAAINTPSSVEGFRLFSTQCLVALGNHEELLAIFTRAKQSNNKRINKHAEKAIGKLMKAKF